MSKKTCSGCRKRRCKLPSDNRRNETSKRSCGVKRKPRPSRPTLFAERVFLNVSTTDEFIALPAQDTSNKTTYSYAIVNKGDEPVVAQLEIGPNEKDYALDSEEIVPGGTTAVVVPVRFQRYTRLLLKSLHAGKPAGIHVYFQAQQLR